MKKKVVEVAEDDEIDTMDFQLDEPTDDEDWEEPNYKEKDWLKKNCLTCQGCSKTFKTTAESLKCFTKHKNKLRCYVCFYTVKGGKDGTKRLFRHYQKRHQQGTKKNTLKCVHCPESISYSVVSCHIIGIHFFDAMGTTHTAAAAAAAIRSKKRPKADTSDEEEESEEEEEDTDDFVASEDSNKKRKVSNGRKAGAKKGGDDDEDGSSEGEEDEEDEEEDSDEEKDKEDDDEDEDGSEEEEED